MPLSAVLSRVVLSAGLLVLVVASVPFAGAEAEQKVVSNKEAISSVLQKQTDSWNKGDLDAFMTGYLQSPEICYTSGGTEVWGYDALRSRYEKKYGKSPESMGKVSFSDLKFIDLGQEHELVIGHWHLLRDSAAEIGGTFSLVLVKTKDGWKIIHDHTSALAPKS